MRSPSPARRVSQIACETLRRYSPFFSLFTDFRGCVEFFLLQDLVTGDDEVRFFMPFDDFAMPANARDIGTYVEYRRVSIEFMNARNTRITKWAIGHPPETFERKGPRG